MIIIIFRENNAVQKHYSIFRLAQVTAVDRRGGEFILWLTFDEALFRTKLGRRQISGHEAFSPQQIFCLDG